MKIEQHPLEDHQVKLIVEVEPERLTANKRKAARKMAERGKIPGFRPGKAPYDVVVRTYGEGPITEEAVDLLVEEIYPKVIEEAGITPGATGKLESIDGLEPPKFTFIIPLEPTVDLGAYRDVRLPYEFTTPGDDKLEAALEELRMMYATTKPVEREIQVGDYVLLDLKGENTAAAEGENPVVVDRQNHAAYVAKEERDSDMPYKGFPQELVGMKIGDKKEFTHSFPADHADEEVRGKTIRYAIEIKAVRGVEMPELNDEFAQTTGAGQTLDELRSAVRADLERRARDEYEDKYFVDLIEQIKTVATIKYPPQVVEHEMEHVLEDLKRRLSEQGMDMDVYLKMRSTDLAGFQESEVRPVAVRRLERSLIMDAVAREEKIKIGEEEMSAEFSQAWAELAARDQQFSKMTRGGTRASKELVDAVAMNTANRLMTRRVLDRLKARANGEEIPVEPPAGTAPSEPAPAAE